MRRLFWLGMGIAVGVLAVRRVTKTAESFTPRGMSRSLANSVGALGEAAGDFVGTMKTAAAEREAELRAELGAEAQTDAPAEPREKDAPDTGSAT